MLIACNVCGSDGELKTFNLFSYAWCPSCKLEIVAVATTKSLLDEAVELLRKDEGHYYLYVSKQPYNLNEVYSHCLSCMDVGAVTSRFVFCTPEGLRTIHNYRIEGAYIDKGSLDETQLDNYIHPLKAWIKWVDGSTLML